jgi:transposase-like protein
MYSKAMRDLVIRKLSADNDVTPSTLAREFGVSRASVYRWLKAVRVEPHFEKTDDEPVPPPGPIKMKRPQDWSAEEKLTAVLEAAAIPDEKLGSFLRRKGVHETHLKQWREQMLNGLNPAPVQAKKKEPESKRVRALERELRRKEKALAETAALLVLKKKAQEIWGDEGDDTNS